MEAASLPEKGSPETHYCHVAKFYHTSDDLLSTMTSFTARGLERDEVVVVLARRNPWQEVRSSLADAGVSVEESIEREELVFIDVESVRRELTADGVPGREAFERVLANAVEELLEAGSKVRVFAEIAGWLVEHGQFEEMLCVEDLWTEYFGNRIWTLCAYQLDAFTEPPNEELFRRACRCHHEVLPAGEEKRGERVAELQLRNLALSSDIHEHRQRESELEKTVEDQRERNRRKDEFLAMLAHELRNPLASMLNAVEIMEARGEGETERERDVIERQLQHVVQLVDDLLDVSRITRGTIELDTGRLEIGEVVEQAIEVSRPAITRKDHQLHVSTPNAPVTVEGDFDRLVQVVSNLLTNAAQYTPEGGDVWLDAGGDGDDVAFRVRDNGTGIEPEVLPKIFEMFHRGEDEESSSSTGLGVGLSLARRIVEGHDGSIEAHSDGLGQGSEFVVRLPSRGTPSASLERAESTGPDETSSGRILIVDDNSDLTETMAELLEIYGYQVQVAHDGPSALEVLETFEAEVALVDLNMPGMSGLELGERLAGREDLEMRIIALTGYDEDNQPFEIEDVEFDEYLVKPARPDELRSLLEDGAQGP